MHIAMTDDATLTKAAYMDAIMANEQHAMAALAHADQSRKNFWHGRVTFWRRMKIIVDSLS